MTAAWQHYAATGRAWTHLLATMPDHLHALISFSFEEQMADVVHDWKRFITRKTSVQWQPGFFDHRLRNPAAFDEKAAYIRLNPFRAKLVSALSGWPFI